MDSLKGFALNVMMITKKHHDRHERGDDVGLQLAVLVAQPHQARGGVGAEEEQPPQQRAVLPTPQRGDEVARRHRPIAVASDVADAEVVGDEAVSEQQDVEDDERARCERGAACGAEQARTS